MSILETTGTWNIPLNYAAAWMPPLYEQLFRMKVIGRTDMPIPSLPLLPPDLPRVPVPSDLFEAMWILSRLCSYMLRKIDAGDQSVAADLHCACTSVNYALEFWLEEAEEQSMNSVILTGIHNLLDLSYRTLYPYSVDMDLGRTVTPDSLPYRNMVYLSNSIMSLCEVAEESYRRRAHRTKMVHRAHSAMYDGNRDPLVF
jgi:hypothetical protein